MAVATIKDLLDPLSKIQATSQSSADSLSAINIALGAQVTGNDAMMSKMDKLIKVSSGLELSVLDLKMLNNLREQTKLLRLIAKGSGKGGKAGKESGGGTGAKLKSAGAGLKLLGQGAVSMAKGLILFRIVPKKTILKFQDFIKTMIERFGKMKVKKVEKGAKALTAMGNAIFLFSKSLAMSALLLIPAVIAIPMLYIAVALLVPMFLLLGMGSKQIQKGAKSLDMMGDAIKSFGIGIAIFALATLFILMKPVILLGMVAALTLISGAVYVIGMFSDQIEDGAWALGAMGLGLIAFGLGFGIFAGAVALAVPDIGTVFLQVGIILGMGLAIGLLGEFVGNIAYGALAIAAMGLGLFVFSLGYLPFALVANTMTAGDVVTQGAILLMLGLEFAAAGFGALFIGAGALAFAAIGGALLLLAPGLAAMKALKYSVADATELATVLAAVKLGFMGGDTEGGFFSAIGGAISGSINAGEMTASADGFAAAGKALTALAPGLKAFRGVGWTDADSIVLSTALTGITTSFAAAGGEPASPGGVFGAIFGNAFSPNSVERGIDSVMDAGKALTSITEGLIAFQKLIDKDVDFTVLGKAITDTVGVVQTAFAAIGGEGSVDQGGFFGSLLGLKQNKVEEGIDSVMNAGAALTGIVDGLTAFQVLVDKDVDFDVLGKAISDTIGFVQNAFSAVAEEGTVEAGGFFNSLFGIKKNKVAEGIDSVSEAGDVLKSIADGLIGFQSLIDKKIDFPTLGKAISDTIGFVQSAFAAVADEGIVEAGGFFNSLFGIKKNKVQEGIDSVSGAGDQLKSIADALTSFSGLKDPEATAGKIKAVLGMVGQAFASIGGSENEESDGNWFISWDENKIQKGIEAVDGAGAALTDIAAGLKAFSGDFKPEAVAASIGTLLTSIGTAFSDLYETNPVISDQLHDFSDFIVTLGNVAEKGLLDKAADGISKIADSINKIDIDKTVAFGELFKSSATLSNDDDAYKALANAVEDIRDMMAEGSGGGESLLDKGLNLVGLGSVKPDKAAKKGPDPMKKLNSTLGRLESAITALPTAIQTMKLEVSLPNQ